MLEVYGIAPSEAIRQAFEEFGFAEFMVTADDVIAKKSRAVT